MNIHTSGSHGWRPGFPKNSPSCDECLAPIRFKPRHGLCLPCAMAHPDRPDRNS